MQVRDASTSASPFTPGGCRLAYIFISPSSALHLYFPSVFLRDVLYYMGGAQFCRSINLYRRLVILRIGFRSGDKLRPSF